MHQETNVTLGHMIGSMIMMFDLGLAVETIRFRRVTMRIWSIAIIIWTVIAPSRVERSPIRSVILIAREGSQ